VLSTARRALRRSPWIALAAAALAALATLGAVRSGADATSDVRAAAAPTASSHDPAARFGILRRPATGNDAMPSQVASTVTGASRIGPDTGLARRAAAPASAGALWAVPAATGLCVARYADVVAEQMCASTEDAVAGLMIATTGGRAAGLPDDQRLLYGIVPDGVSAVDLTLADGTKTRLAVTDNTFTARIAPVAGTVAWDGPDGHVEHTIAAEPRS
jgi:hypothetical protein